MKKLVTLIILFNLVFFAQAKNKYNKRYLRKNLYKAELAITNENTDKALKILRDLNANYSNNLDVLTKLGYCYLYNNELKPQADSILKIAVEQAKSEKKKKEPLFYLAKAYHLNYKTDQALEAYNRLLPMLSEKEEARRQKVESEIEKVKTTQKLMESPVEMVVTNLGDSINSAYDEHSPALTADESILIFTTNREATNGKGLTLEGDFFEDIFVSYNRNGKWSAPKGISPNINTKAHDASVSISADGNELIMFRNDNGDANLYISYFENGNWTTPIKMPSPVNSGFTETHASFSSDKKTIYFTSDRPGGNGGLDLYSSTILPNGFWGEPIHLGNGINTDGDEQGPFVSADGNTLYFSSEGHENMGGFDIFKSDKDVDGNWQKPENMGYPINTPDDDIFLYPAITGNRFYYSSYQFGNVGKTDIYMIELPETDVANLAVIRGFVTFESAPVENAQIEVYEKDADDPVGIYTPDKSTGKYILILPDGNTYTVKCIAEGYEEITRELTIPQRSSYFETNKTLNLKDFKLEKIQ